MLAEPVEKLDTSIADVYAINIISGEIASLVGCKLSNTGLIEKTRSSFWQFLVGMQEIDVIFSSQAAAWEAYVEDVVVFGSDTSTNYEHLNKDDKDNSGKSSWAHDIEQIVARAIRPANYNEFGGQQ